MNEPFGVIMTKGREAMKLPPAPHETENDAVVF